jgi:hypothetical protein
VTWVSGDRIKETTTTTGTGDLTLLGAVAGFRALSVIAANLDTLFYVAAGGTEWEVGYGTWLTGNLLQRTRVFASSNAGALVVFSAGTKEVWVDFPAMQGLPSGDVILPPGSGMVVPDEYSIAVGKELELAAEAVMEIT